MRRLRQISAVTAISVLAGVTSALGLSAAPAQADSATTLALGSYAHMVVDPIHQHIFFSQGSGSTGILVTDLSGNTVATIPGETGATGLALSADGSTLYAALAGADAVSAISTATLTETARYATGTGSAPYSVAVADAKVWYSYTPAAGSGGIGEIDPTAATPTAAPLAGTGTWLTAPLLAAGGDTLAAEEPQANQSHAATFDVATGTPALLANTDVAGGTAGSLRVTPDGSTVLLAAPQGHLLDRYSSATLAQSGETGYFTGGQGPDAIALAADGTVAAGTGTAATGGTDLWLYVDGHPAMSSFGFAPSSIVPDGLAWGADGLSLYAVTKDAAGDYTLQTLSNPRYTSTSIALSAGSAVPTLPFQVSGSLSTNGSIPAGATLQVTRNGVALPDVTIGADGAFSFSDTQNTPGSYTYQVSYAGDSTHRASTAALAVSVNALTTSVGFPTISSNSGTSVSFSGDVLVQQLLEPVPAGTVLHVVRTNTATGVSTTLPDVPVAAGTGAYSVSDVPGPGPQFTYALTYAGNAYLSSSEDDVSVAIATDHPSMTLTAPATATRGAVTTITGALTPDTVEPYTAGETLTVLKTDLAHPAQYSVGTAKLNADGSFSFQDTPQIGGVNSYTFTYPGDATHSSVTATSTVQVSRAATALTVSTNAGTYAYAAWSEITVHLGSTDNSRSVDVYAQPVGGARSLVTEGTVDKNGNFTVWYHLSRTTWISAAFEGDYQYAPAGAGHYVYTHAAVAVAMSGYYGSGTIGGTSYKLYHHTATPVLSAAVAPGKAGQCVYLTVQEYYSGGWHTISSSGCRTLSAASAYASALRLSNANGQDFRAIAEYVQSSKDTSNLTTYSPWYYFAVRT